MKTFFLKKVTLVVIVFLSGSINATHTYSSLGNSIIKGMDKSISNSMVDIKVVRLAYESPTGFYRPIQAVFRDDSTVGYDHGYDAEMFGRQDEDMFWTYDAPRNPGVSDVRPFNISGGIWMGITVVNAGTHKIVIDHIQNFNGNVLILDSNGERHDLRQGAFEVNLTAGFYTFKLVFITDAVVNKGVLKIEEGSIVCINGTYTNDTGAIHTNEGDLVLKRNLINNGTMTESANADTANGTTTFESTTAQKISGTSNAVAFQNLIVNNTSGTGISIPDGMEVTVEKGMTLTAGDIRLVGEAQLVQKHSGADANNGTQNLLMDQQGINGVKYYNYWSSPVSGATAGEYTTAEVLHDGTDATVDGKSFSPQLVTYTQWEPWDGFPAVVDGNGAVTTPSVIASRWIQGFDNGDFWDNTWVMQRETGSFDAGHGFTMKGNGNNANVGRGQNWVFKGKPNDGNYNLSIDENRFTLVGNPYPSALSTDSFVTANVSTTGTIYFWEHWEGTSTHHTATYQGGYASYTPGGGGVAAASLNSNGGTGASGFFASGPVVTNYKIPVAQGFFVRAIAGGGPYTITFDNSMRVFEKEGASSHMFRVSTDTKRVRLKYSSPTGFQRPLLATFRSEGTIGFDRGYDAAMFGRQEEDIFWSYADRLPGVIDVRTFDIDGGIWIGITVINEGIHEIGIDHLENFEEDLFILDANGVTHDLRENDFEVSLETGYHVFKLVFKPTSTASNQNVITSAIDVFYAPISKNIVIDNIDKLTITSIKVFNIIGGLIKEVPKENLHQTKIEIPFNVASGSYFVIVETTTGKANYKIAAY